ncbi:MAG: hypothetical protein KBA31_15840 [Alphaproteobacteria bacterium]|nr:hypothetical protein [Alphaproteobacteria bacterium]
MRTIQLAAAALLAATSAHAGTAAKCDRQLVMQIDSAMVSVEAESVTISAFGVAESAGWSAPTLVLAGSDKDGIVQVDFLACRPEMSAQVLTPVQVREKIAVGAAVRQIVVRAKTNSMTVEITRE